MEFSVPLAELGVKDPRPGTPLSVDIQLDDRDLNGATYLVPSGMSHSDCNTAGYIRGTLK